MSQVRPVSLPDALSITLDNYYDLLKSQVGGLGADEFLQLKLVADPVDIDDERYRFFSLYQLLNRSDLAIDPKPVSGTIMTSAEQLNRVYGRFIQRLRSYVVRRELDEEDQEKIADLDMKMDRNRDQRYQLEIRERRNWLEWCEVMGTDPGDNASYLQWSVRYGNSAQIELLFREFKQFLFDKRVILDKQYREPEDREVIDAEFEYESSEMRLRYPISPDYLYDEQERFSLEYLARLPEGSSALFDDRRAITWNVALDRMKTIVAGSFNATWDRTTSESSSIRTDWSSSASVSYGVISAKASASEHTTIQEEFKKATEIGLSAKSAFKVQTIYPGWFRPSMFSHKRVKENLRDFEDFFGPQGSLRYYPTHLILVRGFSVTFGSSQNWTYDYTRKFNASGGGGFSVFGIKFGASADYGSHVEKHKVDKQNTTLTFSDGESTLRFVGYVVKENSVWGSSIGPAGPGSGGIRSPIDLPGDAATAIQQSGTP
ncbi:MAG: hypothetical protein KDA93_12420 [Planctomycetaceae bacterium]|nr:hypothetical protein [Planctomycetaceae bacterium]